MAAIVKALEAQALIARAPDPEDGRRRLVTLTDSGRHVARNVGQLRLVKGTPHRGGKR